MHLCTQLTKFRASVCMRHSRQWQSAFWRRAASAIILLAHIYDRARIECVCVCVVACAAPTTKLSHQSVTLLAVEDVDATFVAVNMREYCQYAGRQAHM